MKQIKVSSKCVASGICTLMTDLLREDSNGKAIPVGSGIITDSEAEKLMEVIKGCPVNAISLVEAGLVKSSGIQGLMELKNIIKKELLEYKTPRPSTDIYTYRGKASSIPFMSTEGHHRYEYKSDSKAESAGLSHFDRVAYSQRKVIVQRALVEFKVNQLSDLISYEKRPGNYYYDISEPLSKLVLDIVEEIKEKTDNKVKVSINTDRIKIGPDQKDEFYLYRLKNIETIFPERVVGKLDSLSSYKLYVNTDDMEDYRGKDMYCYDLHEVIQQFREDIVDAIKDVFYYEEAIDVEAERVYERYAELLEAELKDIGNYLIKEIDKHLGK